MDSGHPPPSTHQPPGVSFENQIQFLYLCWKCSCGFPICLESTLKPPGHTVFLHKLPRTLASPPSVPGPSSLSTSPSGLPACPPTWSPPAQSGLSVALPATRPASGVVYSSTEGSGQRPPPQQAPSPPHLRLLGTMSEIISEQPKCPLWTDG